VDAGGTISQKYEASSPFSDTSIVLLCAKMVSVTPRLLLTAARKARQGFRLSGNEGLLGSVGLASFCSRDD
jgi:hypothetical protein